MRKHSAFLFLSLLPVMLMAQTADPGRTARWDRQLDYIKNGSMTLSYKTIASPTITGTITLANSETIDNATNGTVKVTSGVFKHAYDAAAYWTATVADGGAVTFDDVSDGTASFSFSDNVNVTYTKTAAADVGTVRALYGKYALTGATAVSTAGNNLVGGRGEFNMASGSSVTGGAYMEGLQAKAIVAGTINHEDSRLACLFAQMDATGAAFTAGQQSVIWADVQIEPTTCASGQFYIARFTDSDADKTVQPTAAMFIYTEASFLLELGAPESNADWWAAGGTDCTASGAQDPAGALKIKLPDGSTGYIRVWAAQ